MSVRVRAVLPGSIEPQGAPELASLKTWDLDPIEFEAILKSPNDRCWRSAVCVAEY